MHALLLKSTIETLLMVLSSIGVGSLIGLMLGIILFSTTAKGLKPHKLVHNILNFIINTGRSLPYIILMISVIPITRLITGTSIGSIAAIVPLSIISSLLIAQITVESLEALPQGLNELSKALGATYFQTIYKILLPEAIPTLISGHTSVIISLISYSTMAGAMGGGGLGDLAVRYGYQRYDMLTMVKVMTILILLVQSVQMLGRYLLKHIKK